MGPVFEEVDGAVPEVDFLKLGIFGWLKDVSGDTVAGETARRYKFPFPTKTG